MTPITPQSKPPLPHHIHFGRRLLTPSQPRTGRTKAGRERKTTTTKTEETVAQPGQQNRNWIDQGVFGMQKVTTTGPRTLLESPLLSAGLK